MRREWQGRRVLVTGATGMTGSFLVERLLSLGAKVRVPVRPAPGRTGNPGSLSHRRNDVECIDGDLSDPRFCAQVLDGTDELLHLASCRRHVAFHHEQSGFVALANVAMTTGLLGALQSMPCIPVTFFSTGNISAALDPLLLQQQVSVDGYVAGKYASELLWLAAARERGFPLLILRPVGIYGPRDTFSADGNVIPSLIIKAMESSDHLLIWGSGQQERSFLYVEDVVAALLHLLASDVQGVQYVSPNEQTTIRELATRIRDLVKPALPLNFDTSRQEGLRRLERKPVHESLDSFPWTSLDEGLRRTVAWWMQSR